MGSKLSSTGHWIGTRGSNQIEVPKWTRRLFFVSLSWGHHRTYCWSPFAKDLFHCHFYLRISFKDKSWQSHLSILWQFPWGTAWLLCRDSFLESHKGLNFLDCRAQSFHRLSSWKGSQVECLGWRCLRCNDQPWHRQSWLILHETKGSEAITFSSRGLLAIELGFWWCFLSASEVLCIS